MIAAFPAVLWPFFRQVILIVVVKYIVLKLFRVCCQKKQYRYCYEFIELWKSRYRYIYINVAFLRYFFIKMSLKCTRTFNPMFFLDIKFSCIIMVFTYQIHISMYLFSFFWDKKVNQYIRKALRVFTYLCCPVQRMD